MVHPRQYIPGMEEKRFPFMDLWQMLVVQPFSFAKTDGFILS